MAKKTDKKEVLIYRQQKHRFFFLAALAVITLSLVGLSFISAQAYGTANIILSLVVSQPSDDVITSQEAVAIIPAGPPAPLLAYLASPPAPAVPAETVEPGPTLVKPAEVTINIFDRQGNLAEGGTISSSGGQSIIPQIVDRRPKFEGKVGVPNAFIFLELHSLHSSAITASFSASQDGSWQWQSPRDIADGLHTIYLTVFDPPGEVKLAQTNFQFEVSSVAPATEPESPKSTVRTKKIILPPSLLEHREALFDISVKLSGQETHTINPGDDVYAQVNLLNIGQPGVLTDVVVNYQLLDQSGKAVYQEKETIAVATQTSYLKVFSTKLDFASGDYRLEVSVNYDNNEAISSVTFTVGGKPIILLPGRARINVTTAIQILIIILSVAIIVAYAEYTQVSNLGKTLKQINEQDLKKEKLIS